MGAVGATEEEREGGEMDRSADGQRPALRSAFIKAAVVVGQSCKPGVTLAASDGTFGVIGGDITPGWSASE